ncbi:MAG: HD domain-containing protein [Myxococcota bacterium]|nr:HD domain-containing protein [Myxococcota bacterium]
MKRQLLQEILALKDLDRAGWLRVGIQNPESVAAHSWGVAMLALLLTPEHLDRERVLALAILHDLPEVRVGDITPHDGVTGEEKTRRESQAAAELLVDFPHLHALWLEYTQRESAEARFVHQLDKLDMGLQAQTYARSQGRDTSEFVESASATVTGELLNLMRDPSSG